MIDLNDMILFTRVVDAGSFSAAARKGGIPKSTLSRRISQLEDSLGIRLLHRTTRSLNLTQSGARFYERCKQVAMAAEAAEQVVQEGESRPSGQLRISVPVETGTLLMGEVISDFLKRYPEVDILVDNSNRFVDLIEEGFDLVIRAGKLEDSSLIARKLATSKQIICASPEYLQERGMPESPKTLDNHPLLLYSRPSGRDRYTFSQDGKSVSLVLNPKLSTNNHFILLDAARRSLGIAILPDMVCRKDLETGHLLPILKQWRLADSGIYAIYPSARHLSPKVRSFVEHILRYLT